MRLEALTALVLLFVSGAALADPATITVLGSILAGSSTTWIMVTGYAMMIGSAIYGADQQRKRAAADREQQRQAYNAGLKDRTVTRIASDAPHRTVYGRARVGSDIVAMFSSGARDEYKHLVCVHAAHECDAIEEIYVNGKALGALDANGEVTGGDYAVIGSVGETETHTGSTFVLAYVPKELLITRPHPTKPAKPRLDVPYTLDGQTVTLSQDFGTVTCTYQRDQVAASRVRVKIHLGTPADPADAALMADLPDLWPDTAVLRGFCYTVVRLDLNHVDFQGGIPPIEVLLRGKKLYDPRSATTVWSQNPALSINDYLTGEMCGVDAGDIPTADLITAANVCDEDIGDGVKRYTVNGTVTADQESGKVLEQLAQCMAGGIVGTTWQCWAGKYVAPVMSLVQDDIVGAWSVIGGVPDAELYNGARGQYISNENEYVLTDFKPYQNAAYLAADGRELWTNIDFPFTDSVQRVHNLARIFTEDQRNGFTIKATFSLKAWSLKVGQRAIFTSALLGQTDKVYRVVDKRFGIEQGVELTLKEDAASIWDFADAVVADETQNTNLPNPMFVTSLAGVYSTSGESELLEVGDGTLIPRIAVHFQRPSNVFVKRTVLRYHRCVGESGYSTGEGFAPPIYIPVEPDGASGEQVAYIENVREGSCYLIELYNENGLGIMSAIDRHFIWADYSLDASVSAVDLTESLAIAAGSVVSKVHVKITADLARYFRIQWWRGDPLQFKITERQFDSEFDIITDAEKGPFNIMVHPVRVSPGDVFNASLYLVGKSAKPADVTGLTFNVSHGKARLSWDASTDLDVIVGGYLVLSHTPELSLGNTLNQYEFQPGSSTGMELPAFCEGTWVAKWLDSSLNASANYASVTVTYSGLPDVKAAMTYDCAPVWSGTKVGCAVDAGGLTMDGTWLSGNSTIATYRDAAYDFGFVGDVGIKAAAQFVAYAEGNISDITEVISLWPSITGASPTDVTIGLYLRTTADDPASPSAVWSEFRPFYIAESFRARGMQIELRMKAVVTTNNAYIESLTVTPILPRMTAAGADVASGAAAKSITYPAQFHESPTITVVPHDMVTGDYYEITSKSATGFTITFKNSAGTAVSRTFDWQANGY